jgi:TP901 family phage tail tape measure protein
MSASGNVRAGRAFVEIMLDQTRLEKGLKAAQAKLKSFGTSLVSAGKGMATAAIVAATPFAFATRTFANFDDQMRMVKGITGATGQEFQSLTNIAEKLGRETSFTARQVAEGMTAMGRMGFNPGEIINAIPAVLNLSRATGTELGESAEIAANNMRVFGLEASEMSSVADILTATANGSAQTLTDLAEGLKMAGPQAAAAKDSIVNVSAALGVLANMGIKGSLAGTALRKAYSQFAKADVQKVLEGFGVATEDANGNLRAMPDIMADIARAMSAMPTAERLRFAESVFDLRGSLAGLQLGGNIDQLDAFIEKLKNVDGTAAGTAKEMDAGIGGAFRRFLSALEGVQITIGRILGEALSPYIDKMALALNRAAEWAASHRELVIVLAKSVAAIGAIGVALVAAGVAVKAMSLAVGGLAVLFTVLKIAVLAPVAAIKSLAAAFAFLKSVMIGMKIAALATWTVLSSPAFLAGAALAGLVAVAWKLSGAWEMCAGSVRGLAGDFRTAFASIGGIVTKTWEAIRTALLSGNLAGAAKTGLAALKLAWLEGLFPLRKAWLELRSFLQDSWTISIHTILKMANNLWFGLLGGLRQIGDGITDAWSFIWDSVLGSFESTLAFIKKNWIEFKGFFDDGLDVGAEIAKIDAEVEANKRQREEKSAGEVSGRQNARETIAREHGEANRAVEEAMQQELALSSQRYAESLAGAASEIEKARNEWRTAMEEVRKRAEEKALEVEEAKKKTQNAAHGTKEASERLGISGDRSTGSWSLDALNSILGNSNPAEERTANAAETSVRLQQETNRQLRKMSEQTLAYGG